MQSGEMHFWAVQSFSRCTFQLRREPGAAANRFSWSSTPDLEDGHCSQGRGCFASCFGQVRSPVVLSYWILVAKSYSTSTHTACLRWDIYYYFEPGRPDRPELWCGRPYAIVAMFSINVSSQIIWRWLNWYLCPITQENKMGPNTKWFPHAAKF